ncbi:MAG: prolipoprotein diacylglyceryl transferase [Patescibacteria group bacterium]|nr:prolipoprotein diacylglyceryl transferase [Patescibacteria group bacterium]
MSFLSLSNQFIFGIFLLIAFGSGFLVLHIQNRILHLNVSLFEKWLPWLIISGLIMSRIFALAALDWVDIFQGTWWQIFYFWDGILSLWGAIIGVILALAILCKKSQQSFGQWLDILVPVFLAMLIFGRLGNFFDGGVYYGQQTDHFPGIIIDNVFFPLSGVRHHPIALYETGFAFVLLIFSFFTRTKLFAGARFLGLIMIYSIWRFLIEFLRFDAVEIWNNVTWDQLVSALVFIALAIFLIIRHGRIKSESQSTQDIQETGGA